MDQEIILVGLVQHRPILDRHRLKDHIFQNLVYLDNHLLDIHRAHEFKIMDETLLLSIIMM